MGLKAQSNCKQISKQVKGLEGKKATYPFLKILSLSAKTTKLTTFHLFAGFLSASTLKLRVLQVVRGRENQNIKKGEPNFCSFSKLQQNGVYPVSVELKKKKTTFFQILL